jgi:predicted dehydrogenase
MAAQQKRIGLIGLSAKGYVWAYRGSRICADEISSSWASRSHLGYLQSTDLYKITALQNSSKASAEAAAKEFKLDGVATYDNPKDIASDSNVDIVAVSVNVPEHYQLIRPAIEAGKDIFSEWPLARNLSEAEELVQMAKKKGIKTVVGLQARQNPSILKAKEIVASGKLGKILGTTMYGHVSASPHNLHCSLLTLVPHLRDTSSALGSQRTSYTDCPLRLVPTSSPSPLVTLLTLSATSSERSRISRRHLPTFVLNTTF